MARTKASVGAKVASGKSSKVRCSAAPAPPSSGSAGSSERPARGSSGGGNPVCPRETPKWQRPITTFFVNKDTNGSNHMDEDGAGSSKSKSRPKRNIIESDDEETAEKVEQPPKNTVLDETIELEPLTGEDSHKLEEYYPTNGEKGKGVGKKTKNKENVDSNIGRKSLKRDLDDNFEESVVKKVKV